MRKGRAGSTESKKETVVKIQVGDGDSLSLGVIVGMVQVGGAQRAFKGRPDRPQ